MYSVSILSAEDGGHGMADDAGGFWRRVIRRLRPDTTVNIPRPPVQHPPSPAISPVRRGPRGIRKRGRLEGLLIATTIVVAIVVGARLLRRVLGREPVAAGLHERSATPQADGNSYGLNDAARSALERLKESTTKARSTVTGAALSASSDLAEAADKAREAVRKAAAEQSESAKWHNKSS